MLNVVNVDLRSSNATFIFARCEAGFFIRRWRRWSSDGAQTSHHSLSHISFPLEIHDIPHHFAHSAWCTITPPPTYLSANPYQPPFLAWTSGRIPTKWSLSLPPGGRDCWLPHDFGCWTLLAARWWSGVDNNNNIIRRSEWKLPHRSRITYRHWRQPKLPNFLCSSNRLFGGGAADGGTAALTTASVCRRYRNEPWTWLDTSTHYLSATDAMERERNQRQNNWTADVLPQQQCQHYRYPWSQADQQDYAADNSRMGSWATWPPQEQNRRPANANHGHDPLRRQHGRCSTISRSSLGATRQFDYDAQTPTVVHPQSLHSAT